MTFLTGAHSGLGRFRHDARSVDERVSLTAVVEAIADIMEDVNRGGVVDRALASRIGGEVQVAVAAAVGTGRISSTTQLVGQQAFWNIVSQHLASTSSAYTDQQARQHLLHYMRTQANRTGADFANFVAGFRRGGGYADRAGDRDGGASLTSARFDGFSVPTRRSFRRCAVRRSIWVCIGRPTGLKFFALAVKRLNCLRARASRGRAMTVCTPLALTIITCSTSCATPSAQARMPTPSRALPPTAFASSATVIRRRSGDGVK